MNLDKEGVGKRVSTGDKDRKTRTVWPSDRTNCNSDGGNKKGTSGVFGVRGERAFREAQSA